MNISNLYVEERFNLLFCKWVELGHLTIEPDLSEILIFSCSKECAFTMTFTFLPMCYLPVSIRLF